MSTTVELHRKDAELQAVRAELVALRAGVWDEIGGSLWLDREQWGVVIDALIQHREASTRRKAAEPDRMTDVRAEICVAVIERINAVDNWPTTDAES